MTATGPRAAPQPRRAPQVSFPDRPLRLPSAFAVGNLPGVKKKKLGRCVDKSVGGCVCDRGWFRPDCSETPITIEIDGNTTECDDARVVQIASPAITNMP